MKQGIKDQKRRFVLFRMKTSRGLKTIRLYFTLTLTWSRNKDLAQSGTYATMKSMMIKMKGAFPDLIIEELPN